MLRTASSSSPPPPTHNPVQKSTLASASASTSTAPVATASGYIALLQEDNVVLRQHALVKLLDCVDVLWHEVAVILPELEGMAEDVNSTNKNDDNNNNNNKSSPTASLRQLAAAVASRVLFYLEEATQALRLALQAGPDYFDPMQVNSPYVQRLVAAALDEFQLIRQKQFDQGVVLTMTESGLQVAELEGLVYRLLEASCQAGHYEFALGLALDAKQADKVQAILQASGPSRKLLLYALEAVTTVVPSKAFRKECLQLIAQGWEHFLSSAADTTTERTTAYHNLVWVYHLLGQAPPVAQVLYKLLSSSSLSSSGNNSEDDVLQALQLCFDLIDTGDYKFGQLVYDSLATLGGAADNTEDSDDDARWGQAQRVLTGGFGAELSLTFLYRNSQADRRIMENLKRSLEERSSGSRSSMLHTAAVVTHSYLHAGTTNDGFLRDYLDWMKKASNWAKFSATASLGVVHASHISEAKHLLQPYLPADPTDGAVVSASGGYAEGGSLFALGLMHGPQVASASRLEMTEFLRNHVRSSHANEVMSHGAALGVGLAAMGSADLSLCQELKDVLDTDSAVAGEAAGMAIGMVLVGTGAGNVDTTIAPQYQEDAAELVAELRSYARETQHEKIIRGIAMGLALMQFGQEEGADATIADMRSDRDPVMRYGAQYALALAYCGTGSNTAIRSLLHTAVSDVSDDVRMAAVIGLAFVLFQTPERVPQLVKLLLESFNPHVRYASCMAVGIAMAGTGDAESIAMLEPMLEDMTDYVRQGALVGTAMMYMQQSDTCNGRKIRSFREKLATIVTEKHQSTLTKMGAILSTGIIDAGGRNLALQLGSRNGFVKMSSAVGLTLWLQHWHWFPMMHMFNMALTPTLTIGLNKDFKYPKNFEIQCNAKPSTFAYPKKLEEKKEEKKKRVETVTLSTTAKEKARLARKRAKEGKEDSAASGMEVEVKSDEASDGDKKEDGSDAEKKEGTDDVDAMDVEDEKKKVKKKREPEPTSFRVSNPSRVTRTQARVCEFDLDQRYRPIRPDERPLGVIMLTDSTPGEEEDLGAVKAPSLEPEGELAPPEPFEWTPPHPPDTTEGGNEEEQD